MADLAIFQLCKAGRYSIYVLLMMLCAFLLNQLDRFLLAITNPSMARDVGYGDIGCVNNLTYPASAFEGVECTNATKENKCLEVKRENETNLCVWTFTGKGFEYDLLAGPIFIVCYTVAGIFVGFTADIYNRKVLMGLCVILWSVVTILTGFVQKYWQLALLRFLLGVFEAGCTPFAASIIADYFSENARATALGIYNWGVYVGYSMSYAVGNFITDANILGQGWRWAYYLSGIPGVIVGAVILLTVKEPVRQRKQIEKSDEDETPLLEKATDTDGANNSFCTKYLRILKQSLNPSLCILFLAGSIRNSSGYVFGYYAQTFYEGEGRSKEEIGEFLSWIPLVGGSLSALLGGLLADYVVKRHGGVARIVVIMASLLLAAPFAAGALFFAPPGAYFCLVPAYLIGEMWISITLAIVIELVPADLRSFWVALYLFVITNIGGNAPLLVTPIRKSFQSHGMSEAHSLTAALYILYPGMYVLGGLMYMCTAIVVRRDLRKTAATEAGKPVARLVDERDEQDLRHD